jgi:hypothetical protein
LCRFKGFYCADLRERRRRWLWEGGAYLGVIGDINFLKK